MNVFSTFRLQNSVVRNWMFVGSSGGGGGPPMVQPVQSGTGRTTTNANGRREIRPPLSKETPAFISTKICVRDYVGSTTDWATSLNSLLQAASHSTPQLGYSLHSRLVHTSAHSQSLLTPARPTQSPSRTQPWSLPPTLPQSWLSMTGSTQPPSQAVDIFSLPSTTQIKPQIRHHNSWVM